MSTLASCRLNTVKGPAVKRHSKTLINKFLTLSIAMLVIAQMGSQSGYAADTTGSSTETKQTEIDLVKQQLESLLVEPATDAPHELNSRIAEATTLIGEGSYEEADLLLGESRKTFPNQPELLVRHAEVLSRLNNDSLAGEPVELLGKSLDIDRKHKQSLWMMALANKQAGNIEATYILLNMLKMEMPSNPTGENRAGDVVTTMIAESAVRLQDAGIPLPFGPRKVSSEHAAAEPEVEQVTPKKDRPPSIAVYISLAQQIVDEFSPDDTVFIYARPAEGSRMPLAVTRLPVKDFPATVVLDESMAMMPSRSLASADIVTVGARVSKAGTAMPFLGDWEKEVRDVPVKTREVISINVDFQLQ